MEWSIIISSAVSTFLLGLFLKNYLPSYMDKKGENLATKEDIQEITLKTEEVQKEFKEGFELFSSDVQFKYDFYFKQYSELYSKLYTIIIQSEYVRHFIKINEKNDISFDEAPFLQMSPTHRVTQPMQCGSDMATTMTQTEKIIETPISQFSKEQLCEYIISNGEYASQTLLKLAVAYRFAHHFYEGNPNTKSSSCREAANEEEFRLIREIVCCIVSEYNFLRQQLKMEFSEIELSSGILKL